MANYGPVITMIVVAIIAGLVLWTQRKTWFGIHSLPSWSRTPASATTTTAQTATAITPASVTGPRRSSQNAGSSAWVAVAVTILVCTVLFGGIYYVLSGTSSGTQAATPATADVGDCLTDELFVMAPAKGDKFSDPISVWTDKPYPHVMRNDFNPNADVLFRMSDKSTQVAHKDGGVNLGYTKTFEFQSLDENEVGVVIHIWRCN